MLWSNLLLGTFPLFCKRFFQIATTTPLYVWRHTALSNSWCLLALQHKAILPFALTLHSCSVSMFVLRGQGAFMQQDYENQSPSPSQKAEAWLYAYRPVLIRLTHCDNGRVWYTKDKAWTHCDSSWQPHVALSDCAHACVFILLLVMPCLGSGVAILPMLQSFGPVDDPVLVMQAFLPLATNKSGTTVTLSNGDDWTRSWLTAELLAV